MTLSREEKHCLYEKQKGLCAFCGRDLREADAQVDHIKPKSRGGSNRPRNLQLFHPSCNNAKGTVSDKKARAIFALGRATCPLVERAVRKDQKEAGATRRKSAIEKAAGKAGATKEKSAIEKAVEGDLKSWERKRRGKEK